MQIHFVIPAFLRNSSLAWCGSHFMSFIHYHFHLNRNGWAPGSYNVIDLNIEWLGEIKCRKPRFYLWHILIISLSSFWSKSMLGPSVASSITTLTTTATAAAAADIFIVLFSVLRKCDSAPFKSTILCTWIQLISYVYEKESGSITLRASSIEHRAPTHMNSQQIRSTYIQFRMVSHTAAANSKHCAAAEYHSLECVVDLPTFHKRKVSCMRTRTRSSRLHYNVCLSVSVFAWHGYGHGMLV